MITRNFSVGIACMALLAIGGEQAALAQSAGSALSPARPVGQVQDRQIWTDSRGQPTDAALILVDFLLRADEHALPVEKYHGRELAARLRGGDPGLEADLTRAFLDYASDVHAGLLDPTKVDKDLHIERAHIDRENLLAGAAATDDMANYLDRLAPQDPTYRRMVERYRSFRSKAADEIWGKKVASGPTLRPGDRNARVGDIRARLTAMGDLDPTAYGRISQDDGARLAAAEQVTDAGGMLDHNYFDPALEDALKRFQARHGLRPDGLVGPATLAQLNISPRERVQQIAVNLERLRWGNQNVGDRYILVNVAGFEMWVMENGQPVFSSRVITGQSDTWETPEFTEIMNHLVVNPTWYVPMSIAKYEMLPKLKQDRDYLAKQGMRLVGADEDEIDWATITPETFPGRVTQMPGDANAMGRVKFMFPNRHSIYLHDTPGKHLFDRDIRDFSHGCIRVEKSHELAEYLLTNQTRNPGSYFDEILESGREQHIPLDEPLAVVLSYRTAWIDENGVEQFRGDIYGRDRAVAQALKAAGVQL